MPRRVSPLEETMREPPAAVIGNSVLLQIINETIGKEVLVETKDGNKFTGIFAGCSPETMDMGLRLAHQITTENEGNLLPKKSEVQEKLQFKYTDVVCMSVLMIEERTIQGFATDREYHESNDDLGVDEGWQQWEGDDESEHVDIEDEGAHHHSRTSKNGGWNVNEMFSKNDQLGVKSTFEEDLSQYSTVDVIDDPEARQRAEQIARQIEGNATSKHNAFLENDDTERDLDKTTEEDEYEMNGRNNNRRSALGSKSARGIGAPVTNKRAEALKGGPGFGGRGPPIPNNRFISGTGTYSGSNGKGPDYRDSPSSVKKDGKYENSGFKGKVHLEQRGPSGSPRGNASDSKEQGGADRRVENLRDWNTQFSNNYQATKDGNTSSEPEKNEETKPSDNAWTKGPPSSLLNSSQASPSATSLSSSQSAPSNDPCESQPTVDEAADNMQKEEQNEENEDNNDEECDEGNADTSSKPPGDPAHKPVEAVKKFTFNLDAPSFVPKSAPTTSTQVVQVQQTPVVQQIPAMMPVQASAPPPMMMTVQPMVMQWPGQQAAVYQASPQGYPYMVNNPTMTAVRPQQGQMTPQMVQAQAGQQRRPPQGQMFVSQQQAAYNPTAVYQTQPAVPVQGFYAGQFTNASVPPPQQYQPMAMAPGQGPAVSMAYVQQQRFVTQPGQQMYVVQQPGVAGAATATRYPTPQQGQPSHEQYPGQPQQGPASQPPTPGPQQPQPVPSPAQSVPLPSQSPAARAYSPHPMAAHAAAPQHQQFFIPPQQHLQQTALFYGQQQQMYYQQQQQMQGIAAAQHAVAQQQQQQQDGSHAEQMAASAQLQQQYMSHEQYGQQQQYMQQQQGYYPQPPPHVRAASMGQQTQYPQQQSQQGMPQVPPAQSQGPPQQQQQAQTQQ